MEISTTIARWSISTPQPKSASSAPSTANFGKDLMTTLIIKADALIVIIECQRQNISL